MNRTSVRETEVPQSDKSIEKVSVCVFGASFDTGNLGVSALAESSIKCILARWPNARVTLVGSGRVEGVQRLNLNGQDIQVDKIPIRFCKNPFLSCHYGVLFFYAILLRILPLTCLRRFVSRRNRYMKTLLDATLFIDISGGDSFSDIYGMRRFTLAFFVRLLPLLLRKDLVMFPQTYGPFKRSRAKRMARFILKRSKRIYSRDKAGLEYVQSLLGEVEAKQRLRFSHDVAFLLDPKAPESLEIGELPNLRTDATILIGLNVSGLIYYGGYTGGNEFGLNIDYRDLIHRVVESLLKKENTMLLLVPHVIPAGDFEGNVENDLSACLDVHGKFARDYSDRIFVARGQYDHCQVKYIIGMCDFFIGTRMHSCIAALSQCIPAVGLAYSKKFAGVFETIGVEHLVVDLRTTDVDAAVAEIDTALQLRQKVVGHLERTIPNVKRQVLGLLEEADSCPKA